MKLTLAIAFFLTATLYASVGFGGGSTYTALLAVSATPYVIIPVVSLLCNIAVVSGNSWRYLRLKLIRFTDVWPLFILSIPAAFLGGKLKVSETVFIGLLCFVLLIAGLRLTFAKVHQLEVPIGEGSQRKHVINGLIGGGIGFYSGIVGIGGGIFLAPVLYRLKWGEAQQIAATCSLFILANSLAGLTGQFMKLGTLDIGSEILPYWPLILAVLIGGTVGNVISLRWLKPDHLRRITGVLIFIVAIRLFIKWSSLVGFM